MKYQLSWKREIHFPRQFVVQLVLFNFLPFRNHLVQRDQPYLNTLKFVKLETASVRILIGYSSISIQVVKQSLKSYLQLVTETMIRSYRNHCFAFISAARKWKIHANHAFSRKSEIHFVRQFPVSIDSFFNSTILSVLGNQLVERDEPSSKTRKNRLKNSS